MLRTGHESGLDDWSGGGGKMGRLVISRMRSWGSLLKAVGSHGKVWNREGMVSDVNVRNVLWRSWVEKPRKEND